MIDTMRKEIIRKLHIIQKWRRGGKGRMLLSPKEFGEAIDDCIRLLRSMSDKDYEYLKERNGNFSREKEAAL